MVDAERNVGDGYMYPIILTKPLSAVVIGGGIVGERKVRGLLAASADVTVISPEVTELIGAWAKEGRIRWEARPYHSGDLTGAGLAYAASGSRAVNAQVAEEARMAGILCNVVDLPDEGSFHVPAVLRGCEVLVTVSTYGEDPARARALRDRIACWLESEDLL